MQLGQHRFKSAVSIRRRGVVVLEFILVAPILLIVLLAALQFGHIILVQQAVSHAAITGAREAGKGATMAELVDTVNQVLATRCIAIGTEASVVLEDPDNVMMPVQQQGALTCDPPATPVLAPRDVRVTVCVDIASQPLGNLLVIFGFDTTGCHVQNSSYVRKE